MSDWQPIETAPKDRRILVYGEGPTKIQIAHWNGKRWVSGASYAVRVTHWMPLPPAPEQAP